MPTRHHTFADLDRIHRAALARAMVLRREAIDAAWHALGAALRRVTHRQGA